MYVKPIEYDNFKDFEVKSTLYGIYYGGGSKELNLIFKPLPRPTYRYEVLNNKHVIVLKTRDLKKAIKKVNSL